MSQVAVITDKEIRSDYEDANCISYKFTKCPDNLNF